MATPTEEGATQEQKLQEACAAELLHGIATLGQNAQIFQLVDDLRKRYGDTVVRPVLQMCQAEVVAQLTQVDRLLWGINMALSRVQWPVIQGFRSMPHAASQFPPAWQQPSISLPPVPTGQALP